MLDYLEDNLKRLPKDDFGKLIQILIGDNLSYIFK